MIRHEGLAGEVEDQLSKLTDSLGAAFASSGDLGSISINEDLDRFKEILQGRAREELREYIQQGELPIQKGDKQYSVSIPHIELPRLRHGDNGGGEGGEGNGKGNGQGQGDASGSGKAGDAPGTHSLEVDISLDDLAAFLGEELELPRIEPKGKREQESEGYRYTGVTHTGPNSLRLFKRSFKEALIRESMSGEYDPEDPIVTPIRDDLRYRSIKPKPMPVDNAVIFHVMDISGSMGEEQKAMARAISFWTDSWIEAHYKNSVHVFIVHDSAAQEVDKDTFFHMKESGGTRISSSYELVKDLIEQRYSPELWNIYLFQYSDGDNWDKSDTAKCITMLKTEILPHVNLFAYGQVKSNSASGDFHRDLDEELGSEQKVVLQKVANKAGVSGAIQRFLSTGR